MLIKFGRFNSGDVKGTITEAVRYHFVPKDARRHRLISISYISLLPCHAGGRGFESRRSRHSNIARLLGVTLFPLGHAMPYMIPYYQSGLLVTFRCTDCDWTYSIQNPCSAAVPRDEEGKAKEQYEAHRCSEFSSKTWHKKTG